MLIFLSERIINQKIKADLKNKNKNREEKEEEEISVLRIFSTLRNQILSRLKKQFLD